MDIPTIIKRALDGKTLTQLAREMGLSHSTLSLIKSEQRVAGGKVIRALIRHPDTRDMMLLFLSQNVTFDDDVVSIVDKHDRS